MKHYKFADEPRILKRVKVRQVLAEERARFDELLETKHYLSSSRTGGQSLRYVAELAVDGKVLRGSSRTDGKPLQLLSVVPTDYD